MLFCTVSMYTCIFKMVLNVCLLLEKLVFRKNDLFLRNGVYNGVFLHKRLFFTRTTKNYAFWSNGGKKHHMYIILSYMYTCIYVWNIPNAALYRGYNHRITKIVC